MISNMNSTVQTQPAMSRTAQYKKITKPLLERKRRARINKCLDELKELMVGALEAEGENISKLEKADILELTVRHLHRLHQPNQIILRNSVDDLQKYQQGFGQCAAEACQFLLSIPGVDLRVGQNLIKHLSNCISSNPLSIKNSNSNRFSPPTSPITYQNENCLPAIKDILTKNLLIDQTKLRSTVRISEIPVMKSSYQPISKSNYEELRPSVITKANVREPYLNSAKNIDEDEEIDIEKVDDMWRPW